MVLCVQDIPLEDTRVAVPFPIKIKPDPVPLFIYDRSFQYDPTIGYSVKVFALSVDTATLLIDPKITLVPFPYTDLVHKADEASLDALVQVVPLFVIIKLLLDLATATN